MYLRKHLFNDCFLVSFFFFHFVSYSFSLENEDVKERNSCGESLEIQNSVSLSA